MYGLEHCNRMAKQFKAKLVQCANKNKKPPHGGGFWKKIHCSLIDIREMETQKILHAESFQKPDGSILKGNRCQLDLSVLRRRRLVQVV